MKLPSAHPVQLVEPRDSAYVLKSQMVQIAELLAPTAAELRPVGHLKQEARAVLFPKRPAGQSWHSLADCVSLNWPVGHGMQRPELVT